MDKLLRLLSENSDYSPAELALMLDETEENIIDRIRSYEKQGIIKGHRAIVDFDAGTSFQPGIDQPTGSKRGFEAYCGGCHIGSYRYERPFALFYGGD